RARWACYGDGRATLIPGRGLYYSADVLPSDPVSRRDHRGRSSSRFCTREHVFLRSDFSIATWKSCSSFGNGPDEMSNNPDSCSGCAAVASKETHLAVEDQGGRRQRADGGHEHRESPGVVVSGSMGRSAGVAPLRVLAT